MTAILIIIYFRIRPSDIVMHEMGHYLGLGHTNDKNHLMHSYDMSDEDLAQTYNALNLNIPYVEKPEIETVLQLTQM